MSHWQYRTLHLVPWDEFDGTFQALEYQHNHHEKIHTSWLIINTIIIDGYNIKNDIDYQLTVKLSIVLDSEDIGMPNLESMGAPSNSLKFTSKVDVEDWIRDWIDEDR